MHEILQQILTYLRGMWRYRWYAVLAAWIVAIPGWIYVAQMPDQYKATARVYVDTDTILRPLLRGLVVQTNVRERLSLMTRTMFSRPKLEKVARMTDLDLQAKSETEMDWLISDLKGRIQLGSGRQHDLYNISFEDNDPELAKRVVQSVLTIFVEDTLGDSRQDSDSAQRFLDQQIAEYEASLNEAENRLSEFKRKYIEFLSGGGGDFFSQLQTAKGELKQARLELEEARRRRNEMQRQMEAVEEFSNLPSGPVSPELVSIDRRLEDLRARVDELLLKYTREYPDVQELERLIADLEQRRKEELEALNSGDKTQSGGGGSAFEQLRIALGSANAEVSAAEARVQEYERRVARLEELVDREPQVQAELKRLNRDYGIKKSRYNTLLARRESVQMGEDVEQTGDNVKFKVVDPPRVPAAPSGPPRLLLSTLVLVLALGAGLGFAFLLSQLRPAIYDGRALQRIAGLPVFGSVSRVWTRESLAKRRTEFGAFVGVGSFLILAYGGVAWLHLAGKGHLDQMLQLLRGWL